MSECPKLGECWPSQESIVSYLEIGALELYVFCVEIFSSSEGYEKSDLTNESHNIALDNPIWLKVFKNRIFRELHPSSRTLLSFTSLTMGLTMRGYHPDFATKFRWSLWSNIIGTLDH
jgi:hypothetical protein